MDSPLTPSHIDEYFVRIQLPRQYHRDQHPRLDLTFLSAIQAHHLTAIPYENLSLHYVPSTVSTPTISLQPLDLHAKLVQRRRGGYCMENNILLYHVLRALEFSVYLTGARLYRDPERKMAGWSGWEHSINIVTLDDGTRYVVDVGYGGHGSKQPLPLLNDPTATVTKNIGTQSVRLIRDTLPGSSTSPSGVVWMYQFRMGTDANHPWTPGYAFAEIEFFPRDFEVMNFFTSRSAECFLTTQVLIVLFLPEGDRVVGKIVLDHDTVKRNLGGRNEVVQVFGSEEERVEGLRRLFGIELTGDEQQGIQGRVSAIIQ